MTCEASQIFLPGRLTRRNPAFLRHRHPSIYQVSAVLMFSVLVRPAKIEDPLSDSEQHQ